MKRKKLFNQSGQATVELALTVVIFLGFMLVFSDMVRICYHWVSLQYAVNEGARFTSLGETTGTLDRTASIEAEITGIAEGLGVKNVTVSFEDSAGGTTPGAPTTVLTVQAQTPVTINPLSGSFLTLFGDYSKTYSVSAETVVRNEPFT